MKRLFPSSQFKKDYKRYRNQPKKKAALQEILEFLIHDQPIPAQYSPHPLKGQYNGCMECHVGNDFLLIWIDRVHDIIELVRLGSHSELFE